MNILNAFSRNEDTQIKEFKPQKTHLTKFILNLSHDEIESSKKTENLASQFIKEYSNLNKESLSLDELEFCALEAESIQNALKKQPTPGIISKVFSSIFSIQSVAKSLQDTHDGIIELIKKKKVAILQTELEPIIKSMIEAKNRDATAKIKNLEDKNTELKQTNGDKDDIEENNETIIFLKKRMEENSQGIREKALTQATLFVEKPESFLGQALNIKLKKFFAQKVAIEDYLIEIAKDKTKKTIEGQIKKDQEIINRPDSNAFIDKKITSLKESIRILDNFITESTNTGNDLTKSVNKSIDATKLNEMKAQLKEEKNTLFRMERLKDPAYIKKLQDPKFIDKLENEINQAVSLLLSDPHAPETINLSKYWTYPITYDLLKELASVIQKEQELFTKQIKKFVKTLSAEEIEKTHELFIKNNPLKFPRTDSKKLDEIKNEEFAVLFKEGILKESDVTYQESDVKNEELLRSEVENLGAFGDQKKLNIKTLNLKNESDETKLVTSEININLVTSETKTEQPPGPPVQEEKFDFEEIQKIHDLFLTTNPIKFKKSNTDEFNKIKEEEFGMRVQYYKSPEVLDDQKNLE